MRVGIDVSPLVQTRAGTARYVAHLLAELPELEQLRFDGRGRLATALRDLWWYPVALPRAARRLDVLHCPTFRAPLRPGVPLVITVHDLAVLRHPGTFNQWSRHYSRLAVPRVARAARLVIAVSEFTKGELQELLRVPEEKIYIRLEDVIVIGEKTAEVVSSFVPEDPEAIEKIMTEEGLLKRHPAVDLTKP